MSEPRPTAKRRPFAAAKKVQTLCRRAKKKLDQAIAPCTCPATSLVASSVGARGLTGVVVMRELRRTIPSQRDFSYLICKVAARAGYTARTVACSMVRSARVFRPSASERWFGFDECTHDGGQYAVVVVGGWRVVQSQRRSLRGTVLYVGWCPCTCLLDLPFDVKVLRILHGIEEPALWSCRSVVRQIRPGYGERLPVPARAVEDGVTGRVHVDEHQLAVARISSQF